MGLQVEGRKKEGGGRELDARDKGLVGRCLRKSKAAGVHLLTLPVAALSSNAALTFACRNMRAEHAGYLLLRLLLKFR